MLDSAKATLAMSLWSFWAAWDRVMSRPVLYAGWLSNLLWVDCFACQRSGLVHTLVCTSALVWAWLIQFVKNLAPDIVSCARRTVGRQLTVRKSGRRKHREQSARWSLQIRVAHNAPPTAVGSFKAPKSQFPGCVDRAWVRRLDPAPNICRKLFGESNSKSNVTGLWLFWIRCDLHRRRWFSWWNNCSQPGRHGKRKHHLHRTS